MKRTIIGGIFALCGAIIDTGVLMSAAFYATTLSAWSGSKAWYAIFGGKIYENQADLSLRYGVPFAIGAVLLIAGIAMLIAELLRSGKKDGKA